MWIRYSIRPQSGRIDSVKPAPGVREYVIDGTYLGEPARSANIVVYAPGCQFKTYMLDLRDASDVTRDFVCDPLPTKTIHGFLPPQQIPRSWVGTDKAFDIVGEIDNDWTCTFLMTQQYADRTLIAGSCLGKGIPLGRVGEIHAAKKGYFDITIPDFARDPAFVVYWAWPNSRGIIELALREKSIDRGRASIQPEDAPPRLGLSIRADYPDTIAFTTSH